MPKTLQINMPGATIESTLEKAQTDVATTPNQVLSNQQKENARDNINAIDSEDVGNLARKDGSYPGMSVGSALTVPFSGISSTPSTLEGYGIQDTYRKDEIPGKLAKVITNTASGSVVTIEDGANNAEIKSLVAKIVATQSGSGDPSPDNKKLISGWNGVKITRCDVNMFNPSIASWKKNYRINNTNGDISQNNAMKYSQHYYKGLPTGTYAIRTYKTVTSNIGVNIALYDSNKNWLQTLIAIPPTTTTGYLEGTFVIPIDSAYYRIASIDRNDSASLTITKGTTPTAQPYSETTYNISFDSAGTVYGLDRDPRTTIDIITGLLTINYKLRTFTGDNTESWEYKSSNSGQAAIKINDKALRTSPLDYKTNMFICVSSSSGIPADKAALVVGTANNTFYVCGLNHIGITSLSDWTNFLSSNSLQILYPCSSPVTYQLTPVQIKTLFGLNNIWADTGDVTVTYAADTKLYIDTRINSIMATLANT